MKNRKWILRAAAVWAAVIWGGSGREAMANLIITPTFANNIKNDANSAAIENVIDQAIDNYETDFANPIDVTIKFQEMTSGLGESSWWYYNIPYQEFISALSADQSSADDAIALAHLPTGADNPVNGSADINVKTANLRAIGITGLNSEIAGGYDGVVSLNTHVTDVGSAGTSGQYSLISTTEHEIDEVLGLGSALPSGLTNDDPLPEDLFRYTAEGSRSFVTTGDDTYFSLDGTTDLARFNQDSSGDYGDWWSGNGVGNPGPNPPTQVQDAYLYPDRTPTLGIELTALDVIGYDRINAPEPISGALMACGLSLVGLRRRIGNK